MAQKENLRIARTKKRVKESLVQLLHTKSIYKISIKELCSQAGINRSTFYNHYGNQYDVLTEIEEEYLQEIADRINSANIHDKESVLARVTMVMQYIEDHILFSKLLMNNNIDSRFSEKLFALPKIEEMLKETLITVPDDETKTSTIAFAIYGSYKLLQSWVNTDNRKPAEEQARQILTLARKVCNI